ncbi:hypothetical protein C6P40_003461 [Pichia californica]|uniref:Uncharacterized protein n=1 Tax=Pichia californica TaxID=460514 RepID=A0A9P6WGG0_9ASCO|nr:hypothetical protein C6P42_003285 [[Candida] californica]KAG0686739.1 hypothetical protein C6P40_003461 [[Candida] californica]
MSELTSPISLSEFKSAITLLSDSELTTVYKNLTISLQHLQETNNYLRNEINNETSASELNNIHENHNNNDEDIKLYSNVIEENLILITTQKSRLKLVTDLMSLKCLPIPK